MILQRGYEITQFTKLQEKIIITEKKNPLLLFGGKLRKKKQSYKVTPCYCSVNLSRGQGIELGYTDTTVNNTQTFTATRFVCTVMQASPSFRKHMERCLQSAFLFFKINFGI